MVCDNNKTITKSTRKNSDANLNLSNITGSTDAGSSLKLEKHVTDACTGAELVKAQSLIGVVAKAVDADAEIADSRTGTELVERKLIKAELVKARPQSLIDVLAKAIDYGTEANLGERFAAFKLVRKVKARPQSPVDTVTKVIDADAEAADSRTGTKLVERKLVKARPQSLIDVVAKAIDDGTYDELQEKSAVSKLERKVKARPQSLIGVVAKALDAGDASSPRCELVCKELKKPWESHSTRLTSMEINNNENCPRKRPASLRSSIGSSKSSKNVKTQSLTHSGKADVIKTHSSRNSSKKGTLRSTGVTGDVDEEQLDSEVGDDRFPKLKVKVVDYEGTLNWKKCLRKISVTKKNSNASRKPVNKFEGKVRELARSFEGIGKEVDTPQKPKVT